MSLGSRSFAPMLFGAALCAGQSASDPTATGWGQVPFTYEIQYPYNLKASDRYSYDSLTGIHDFWVLKTDKPHAPPPNTTAPRTEMRFFNDYRSGGHLFDADVYIVSGTDDTNIMQVFLASQVRVYSPGTLKEAASKAVLMTGAYDKWFNLKVEHDADAHVIRYYIDNVLKYSRKDDRKPAWYFKCGVYTVATRSEARFKNIRYWRKGFPSALPALRIQVSASGRRLLLPLEDPVGGFSGAAFDLTGRSMAVRARPTAPLALIPAPLK